MNKNVGRIISMVVLVALFGARVYNAQQQKKAREDQRRMIEQISRQQTKERMEMYNQNVQDAMDDAMKDLNLDSLRNALDSIGDKMKQDQESFNRKIDSINNH